MPDLARRIWTWFDDKPKHQRIAIVVGLVVLLAFAVAAIGATFRFTPAANDALDTGGPRGEPPADVRSALEHRFAPVLKLDSRELLVPIDITSYVSATRLEKRIGRTVSVLQDAPTPATLPTVAGDCVPAQSCTYQLDIRGAHPPHAAAAMGKISDELVKHGARLTVYSHVLRYEKSGDYAVQYWFLYLYNYRLNEHDSDWEQITIGLDDHQNPQQVLYSSHATGFTTDWKNLERVGDHPVVYPALGSHANYFHAGSQIVTLLCTLTLCISNSQVNDIADGQGLHLEPANYQVQELTTPIYVGSYGQGNYVAGVRKNEVLADPRSRTVWNNPLGRLVLGKKR